MLARATVWSTWMGGSQVNSPSSSLGIGSGVDAGDPLPDATGVPAGSGDAVAPSVGLDDGLVQAARRGR